MLRSLGRTSWGPILVWRLFQVLTAAALVWVGWRLLGHTPYRIDIEVYRMGGRAWLDGNPLYADGVSFSTQIGLDLPFTYPPLAAIAFAPFAMLPFTAASIVITAITLVLLVVATTIVLHRLDVWPRTDITPEPAWLRQAWLAGAVVVPAVVFLEPLQANFDFGQINVVLMTLVIADLVPRTTPWPRGVLLGLAIALKLTPAVFLLYLLLRRDVRALIVAAVSVVVATGIGFAFAWHDSCEYWFTTLRNTDRIGSAALNTNQNIAGTLARLGLSEGLRFVLWTVACFAVLALTVWAARRVMHSEPVLALVCVAMFGLVVSPVSWSHHWVWILPTVVVTAVVAYRRRDVALAAVTLAGVALTAWTPITLMPKHHEADAPLWRQLAGGSYLWWALAVIIAVGFASTSRAQRNQPAVESAPVTAAN